MSLVSVWVLIRSLPNSNYSGHWYFTKLVVPTMIDTAKDTPDKKARVVNTSSAGHMFFTLDFDTFRDGPKRIKLGKRYLYAQSKFVSGLFAG